MAGYVLDTWILHKLGLNEVNAAIDNGSPIPSCFIWLALRLCPSALNIMEPPLFQHWSARLKRVTCVHGSWHMYRFSNEAKYGIDTLFQLVHLA